MRLFGRTPQPADPTNRALIAAGTNINLKDAASWQMFKLGDRRWQLESWRHYDICGEMRFVVNWLGQALSRCRLYVAQINPETGDPGDETTDPNIQTLIHNMFGGPGSKSEAQRLLGINLLVAGEAYIVCENHDTDRDVWYVVSSSEVYRQGDTIAVRRSMRYGGGKYTLKPASDLLIRVWNPHPRVYDASDSTVRAVLPVLREIEQSTKRVFAEIDSRLAGAGILVLPDSIDFPREPGIDQNATGFAATLQDAMATSLTNRDSAAAIVPIVIQVPVDAVDKITRLTFESAISDTIIQLRKESVTRLATSLDVPPEVLLGMGGSSHWNAWQVEETTIKVHVEPVLIRIADALTTAYLWPALKAMGITDPEQYTFWFDVSPLAVRPNRSDQALQYNEKGLLSDEATRNYGDFPDDDRPSDDETTVKFLRQLVLAQPALVSDPQIQKLLGLPEIAAPAPPAAPLPPDTEFDEQGNPINAEPADVGARQLPATSTSTTGPENVAASALFFAADAACRRALELANTRNTRATERSKHADTPRMQLHTQVWVDETRVPALLAGAWDYITEQAPLLGVHPEDLTRLLEGYVTALLSSGTPHSPELLRTVLTRARATVPA